MKKLIVMILICLLAAQFALAEGTVDVDFTQIADGDVTDALYDLLDAPEANQGKTARFSGYAHYIGDTDGDGPLFYLSVGGGAACCAELVAFIPKAMPGKLDAVALAANAVTVTGTLDFYDAGGYEDVRLLDALVVWPEI